MRRFRKRSAATAALIGALLWHPELPGADTPRPAITVYVYNYARIGPKDLGDAKRIAGRVLREAGVEARWRNAPIERMATGDPRRKEVFGPATLVLHLLSGEMTRRLGFQRNHYGFALSAPEGGFPFVAGVFCRRAEQLTNGTPSLLPVILGHVIAHEIGHLLLGPGNHSERGIMRAPWSEAELEIAQTRGLRFSPVEARRLRAGAAARNEAAAHTARVSPEPADRHFRAEGVRPR